MRNRFFAVDGLEDDAEDEKAAVDEVMGEEFDLDVAGEDERADEKPEENGGRGASANQQGFLQPPGALGDHGSFRVRWETERRLASHAPARGLRFAGRSFIQYL